MEPKSLKGIETKKWDEQNEAERMETLRQELMNFRWLLNRVSTLEGQIWEMQNHSHAQDGKCVVPLNTHLGGLGSSMTAGTAAFDRLR